MKILLSAGHGGKDSGSVGADKGKEKDRTLNLTNKVANKLKNAGHSVTVKQEKTTTGAWAFKNRNGYDYALSIHFNAFNGSATGTEVLYKNTSKKAVEMSKQVSKVLDIKNRGAKNRTDLYMLNIGFDNLIEVCFHDNSSDLEKYNANIDKVAGVIANVINGGTIEKTTTTKPTTTNTSKLPSLKAYKGTSIVDGLNSIGVDSSFNNRAKIYKLAGFNDTYKGTATQNTNLLNKLKGVSSTNKTTTTSYYAKYRGSSSSLVDALKTMGINSSFNNRKAIAKKNGISVYLGTASQNTKLLSLLKQGKLKK